MIELGKETEREMPWFLRMILSFLPVLLLAYLYSGWKLFDALIRVLSWPKDQVRLYLAAGIGYLNLHPVALFLLNFVGLKSFTKSVHQGIKIWDILFSYPFWFGLILVAEVLPWILLVDLIKFPLLPFFKKYKSSWLDIQSIVFMTLTLLFAFYILIRTFLDTNNIRLSKVVYATTEIPATLDGLTIVHISDVQADPRTRKRKLRSYINKVNKLKPDLIFFTGDLVTSGTEYIEMGAQALGNLQAKYGTYACLGDHDYWAGEQEVIHSLERNGVTVLEDSNYFVRVGFDSLLVTFVTNVYSKRPTLDKLNALMGSQPRGVLDILVTHQPSENLVEMSAERGYHLFFAGHTHGGQIVFRPFGFTFTLSRLESPFFRGFQYFQQMLVSINNGLGLTFAPFRYRAPAEISLILIKRLSS
ncbi:MAG: metallophosphoesterase [bacterium]